MVTSLLKSLHWLLLAFGIKVKILNENCKGQHSLPFADLASCILAVPFFHLDLLSPAHLALSPTSETFVHVNHCLPHRNKDLACPPSLFHMTPRTSVLCMFTDSEHQSLALLT